MRKLSNFCLAAICYLIGVPFYLIGGLYAICHEAFAQGFMAAKLYLKTLN